MSNRDTLLFNVPRTSQFGLLMSDGEDEDAELVVSSGDAAAASNGSGTEGASIETESPAGKLPVQTEAAKDPQDDSWSCVARKTHKKTPSHAARPPAATIGLMGRKDPSEALSMEQLCVEKTLEIHEFPESWRTSDLHRLLGVFDGEYRLKWQGDTSCWVHFESAATAARALLEIRDEQARVRPFAPENVLPAAPRRDSASSWLPSPTTTLELAGFPSSWRAAELNRLLASFSGHYRLKWRNDSSCWVIFDSPEQLGRARTEIAIDAGITVLPYVEEASKAEAC